MRRNRSHRRKVSSVSNWKRDFASSWSLPNRCSPTRFRWRRRARTHLRLRDPRLQRGGPLRRSQAEQDRRPRQKVQRIFASKEALEEAEKETYGTVKLLEDTDGDWRMDRVLIWADRLPPGRPDRQLRNRPRTTSAGCHRNNSRPSCAAHQREIETPAGPVASGGGPILR